MKRREAEQELARQNGLPGTRQGSDCKVYNVQVDAFCRADGKVKVVGYYHANERLNELDLKPAARKIADRIQQRIPQAVTLLVTFLNLTSCL